MNESTGQVRRATVSDAAAVAALLDEFNREFDVPTPGVDVLAARLRVLLAGTSTLALLAGTPEVGVALVTRRPNVWHDGPVDLLDELYVRPELRGRGIGAALLRRLVVEAHADGVERIEIGVDEGDLDAQRFYERHGFARTEPDSAERAFWYWRDLGV